MDKPTLEGGRGKWGFYTHKLIYTHHKKVYKMHFKLLAVIEDTLGFRFLAKIWRIFIDTMYVVCCINGEYYNFGIRE